MARQLNTPRQAKQWDALPGIEFAMTADGTFSGPVFAFSAPFTVLRMLGEYTIAPTAVVVAGERCEVAVAIGVVSTDAATLGATALPDPISEPDFPWLYWAMHPLHWGAAVSGTAGEGPQGVAGSVRKSFDIRSMRKMKPRESLVLVAQYGDLGGTPPVTTIVMPTRVLLGLH